MMLFDIDGTLLDGSEAHRLAFRHGFARAYDIEPQENPQRYDGQTDLYIIRHKCQDCGIGERQINAGLHGMFAEMCRVYNRFLIRYPVKVYPGSIAALEYLKTKGYKTRLVTGNLRCIARLKLMSVGIWDFFDDGAFGEMSEDRADLVRRAMQGEPSIGFGDTPADIKAYREAGAIAIGVASGMTFTKEHLQDADMIIDAVTPETVKEVLERFSDKLQK